MNTKTFLVLFVAAICFYLACGVVVTNTAASIASMQKSQAAKYNF